MKNIIQTVTDKYAAGEMTLRQAAEAFHGAGFDTYVNERATKARIDGQLFRIAQQ